MASPGLVLNLDKSWPQILDRPRLPPALDLALHRLEITLNSVDANGQCVDQGEAFAMLGQNGTERA